MGLAVFASIDSLGFQGFQTSFIKKRLLRIAPLHYLTMLVFVVFIVPALLFEKFWLNLVSHLFFFHNLLPNFHGSINGSNWSLGVEMQFYLMLLVISPWLYRTKIWAILIAFIATAWVWRYAAFTLIPIDSVTGSYKLFVGATQLPGMLDEFAVGLALAKLLRSSSGANLLQYFGTPLRSAFAALTAMLMFYLILRVYWPFASYWDVKPMVVFFRTLLAFSFGSLVFAACVIRPGKLLSWITTPLSYLGTISYGIYLWHLPVILSIKRVEWLSPSQSLWWVMALTIVFASVSWHFFERPLIKKFA